MNDGRDYWIVRIGERYFGGIGVSFSNEACLGAVLTKIREHAERFTSLDSAKAIAADFGGQVCKVCTTIKGPPCCNRNGPGSNEP